VVLKTAGLSASINVWRRCEVLGEHAVPTPSTRLILPVPHIPRRSADKFRSQGTRLASTNIALTGALCSFRLRTVCRC
jgi:hypothetical protein